MVTGIHGGMSSRFTSHKPNARRQIGRLNHEHHLPFLPCRHCSLQTWDHAAMARCANTAYFEDAGRMDRALTAQGRAAGERSASVGLQFRPLIGGAGKSPATRLRHPLTRDLRSEDEWITGDEVLPALCWGQGRGHPPSRQLYITPGLSEVRKASEDHLMLSAIRTL
jgi:hypothetical protein